MSDQPLKGGACCPGRISGVTQVQLGGGHTVGLVGLDTVFERLFAVGKTPDEITDAEWVRMVRSARNYIPFKSAIEAKYAAALRREYHSFHARRVGQTL